MRLDDLLQRREAWAAGFVARHGRRPAAEDVAADAGAAALQRRVRELQRAAAEPRGDGQCAHFIQRRGRFCSARTAHAAADFCSQHQPTAGPQPERAAVPPALASGAAAEVVVAPPPRGRRGVKSNLQRTPRRMTNPLAAQCQAPAVAPDWAAVLPGGSRPLWLDIGCAKGRFLQRLAQRRPASYNYVGVEIFAPLVAAANGWAAAQGVRHLHYVAANINASLESLRLPHLRVVTLQFPDPWHEKHGKRRVMSPAFAQRLAAVLPPGGLFYFCSDHANIAEHIRDCALGTGAFESLSDDAIAAAEASEGMLWDGGEEVLPSAAGRADPPHHPAAKAAAGPDWLQRSPFPVPTERDCVCEVQWRPVWRMMLRRLT